MCASAVSLGFVTRTLKRPVSEKSEKASERLRQEAQHLIRKVAEPCPAGDSTKAAIGRAARRMRWSFNRVKDIWYGDIRICLSGAEIDQLRSAAAVAGVAVDDDVTALRERIERLERILAAVAPELVGERADR